MPQLTVPAEASTVGSKVDTLLEDVKRRGLSIEEAAQKRGVSVVSARVMLHRILKWLNRAWHDENV
jgi:molybdenum-dependent DNA-binding transcriptional regulator ModE